MTSTLEDVKPLSIDKWGSLNTSASSSRLPEGQSPDNQNVWMDEKPGSVVTANGYTKLGENPSGNPNTFLIDYFKTSDGSQVVVLSDGETVWKTTDYVNYTEIQTGLSPFFQLRGLVIRGKLWMTNGSDPVMTYDGTTLTVLDGSGGTPNVPIAKYISYHDERVWLYGINGDPSSLRFSDLADSSGTEITPDDASAWPSDNEIQISEGDDDIGTGLFLYRGYLYASKSYSIWRIVGYDEYTYTKVKTRSSTGTRFQESVAVLDNLVHFIGVDGLYTFNGEDSDRISDIIDPASSDEGVFAFRNLQQPLLNNQFWNVSDTADFAAGTVPANISTDDDKLTLVPADDTDADFNAGTHDDTVASSGSLQLDLVSSGGTTEDVALGGTPSLSGVGSSIIGLASYINDDSLVNPCGFQHYNLSGQIATNWEVIFSSLKTIGRVTIKDFYAEGSIPFFTTVFKLQYTLDGSSWSDVPGGTLTFPSTSRTSGTIIYSTVSGGSVGGAFIDEVDVSLNFSIIQALGLRVALVSDAGNFTIKELQVFRAGYETDGKFISKAIDYGAIPASFGELAAEITANGETYQFFTQSSADGSTWGSEVNVSNGAAIGSTLKRYLRWGVYLNSATGLNTPVVDKVFVGGTYISEIHNTGGDIFQWGAFQLTLNKMGQTVNAYYRAAPTSGGVSAESWTAIVTGAIPGADITDAYIQIRLEFSTADATFEPFVSSFTVNWILSSSSGVNTLQNVAGFVWLNRYWLSAATLGAESNDIVIVRGKSTFGSPWHKKDFALLSFARFQDYFIAGSSVDGSIYRMEYGFSKDGEVMDSFFETADFVGDGGFVRKFCELSVSTDRLGPYNLTVGYSVDGGLSWTDKTIDLTRSSSTQNLSFVKKLNISFMADKVRFRFRINAADQPFSVDSLDAYYRLTTWRGSLN